MRKPMILSYVRDWRYGKPNFNVSCHRLQWHFTTNRFYTIQIWRFHLAFVRYQ